MEIDFRWLGRVDYRQTRDLQIALNLDRQADRIPDTVLFCEHPPVITLGRGFLRNPSPITAPSTIPVVEIERGGLATYHGPGQLVVYPIFKFNRKSELPALRGVVDLIRFLEAWVIWALEKYEVKAQTVSGKTGVWVNGERKIASIGIGVRHWVSLHGMAINLQTPPEVWEWIQPCGFSSREMTNLSTECGKEIDPEFFAKELEEIVTRLLNHCR